MGGGLGLLLYESESLLILPAMILAGAIGGMLIPAAIFLIFNSSGPSQSGWGIPMATDIAFTLGIITMFGSRIPLALKVFFVAMAIADDLGAILVIALFYSSDISMVALAVAVGFLVVLVVLVVGEDLLFR